MTHKDRIRDHATAPGRVRPRASAGGANRRTRDRLASDAVVSAYLHDIANPHPRALPREAARVGRRRAPMLELPND